MEYAEAIEFLYGLRLFGTKLGLENTFALTRLCGNPEKGLRFIHVAGTNGKGSVCAMLESIYRASGVRTGMFTSPHLVSFTERIQVNRKPISEEDVGRLMEGMAERLGTKPEEWPFRPTFFEFVTVMALQYFREQRCELVIWETGMGGRLDATNIVTPLASVITNVQFDHQQWLGNTIEAIAREKAGIIKAGVPVVTGCEAGEGLEVIEQAAREHVCELVVAGEAERLGAMSHPELALTGAHQQVNAAVALATVETLERAIPVSNEAIRRGLANTSWPGRMQEFRAGSSRVLLDGAHNPAGAEALGAALESTFGGEEVTLVLGLFRDKAWQQMCESLVTRAKRVFLAPIQSERSADLEEVRAYCEEQWPQIPVQSAPTLAAALEGALEFKFVVVAGSLHLIGEAMQHLGIAPWKRSEGGLNEWDAAASGKAVR